MHTIQDDASPYSPWNKGKLTGQKPPLQPKHVWAIATRLQLAEAKRDLALFNLAIDSKLRGCDLVSLRVQDVAPHGYAIERATVRQKKTRRLVRFELTEQTRLAIDEYLAARGRRSGDYLFRQTGRTLPDNSTICAACFGVDWRRWIRPPIIWNSLVATHEGDADLSPHGQSSGGSASARTYQDRKYRQISGHRSRRRLGYFRAS
jgi:integrase